MDLTSALETLRITPCEAADLLDVGIATLAEWMSGQVAVPTTAALTLRAWLKLNAAMIPWRPGAAVFDFLTVDETSRHRQLAGEHARELVEVLDRVAARDGPASLWHVDLVQREATCPPFRVWFYPLENGSFRPSSYSRDDVDPDIGRDLVILEDAFASIARKIGETNSIGEPVKYWPMPD
jgi:hypothetical protein